MQLTITHIGHIGWGNGDGAESTNKEAGGGFS